MAETDIKIRGLKQTRALFKSLAARLTNPTPALDAVGNLLLTSVLQNFEVGGRPKWKPLKPATQKKKKRHPDKILIESQTLMDSITFKVEKRGRRLVLGTNVTYARVHQFGFKGTIEQRVRAHTRAGRPVKAFTRTIRQNIPARPFILIQRKDQTEIKRILTL